jgi:hypothetical protein
MNDYQDGRRDEAYLRGLSQEIKALKVERDAYRVRYESYYALEQQVIKLRAALEAIAYWGPVSTSGEPVMSMQEIARRALEAGGEK